MLALGLLAIITAMLFPVFINLRKQKELSENAREIVATLRRAQAFSQNGTKGSKWGVYFEAPGTGQHFYQMRTYSPATTTEELFYLPPSIGFTGITSTEIIFKQNTGQTDSGINHLLNVGLTTTEEKKQISVTKEGKIEAKTITTSHPLQDTGIAYPFAFCPDWDYNMGYEFIAGANGIVNKLGGRWNDGSTKPVRLYRSSDGACLAKTSVSSSGGAWTYGAVTDCTTGAPISPVSINSGSTYVVAVRGLASGARNCYNIFSTNPDIVSGNVTITRSLYSFSVDTIPVTTDQFNMNGQADITFEY